MQNQAQDAKVQWRDGNCECKCQFLKYANRQKLET